MMTEDFETIDGNEAAVGAAGESDFVAGVGPIAAVEIVEGNAAQLELEGTGSVAFNLDVHYDGL